MNSISNSILDEQTPSVIVAEDERELREYYRRVLPHLGFQLLAIAASGEELVQLCSQVIPNLIISDATLGDMTGPAAVRIIRRKHPVSVIYVTENQHEDLIAANAECASILAKPFRMPELAHALQEVLTKQKSSSNLK